MKAEQGREKQLFFKPILNAWNAIAFDRYEPDSNAFRSARHILTGNYGRIASFPIRYKLKSSRRENRK